MKLNVKIQNKDFEKEIYKELEKYELSNSDVDMIQEILDRYAFEFDTPQTRKEIYQLIRKMCRLKIEVRADKLRKINGQL